MRFLLEPPEFGFDFDLDPSIPLRCPRRSGRYRTISEARGT